MSLRAGMRRPLDDTRVAKRARTQRIPDLVGGQTLPVGVSPVPPSKRYNTDKLDALFHSYADNKTQVIQGQSFVNFCRDLGVPVNDIRIACLSYHLGAESRNVITRSEFSRLAQFHCQDMSDLQGVLKKLYTGLEDPDYYKNIYLFAFQWAKPTRVTKVLPSATVRDLLTSYFANQFPQVASFVEFLKSREGQPRLINEDTWAGFYQFCRTHSPHDLYRNYDEDGAWPLLVDEYVEWYRECKVPR